MTDVLKRAAELVPMGPAGAFVFTDDEVALVGAGAKAFPVQLRVNGHTFALRLARMGGQNLIGLRREVREAAGLTLGDVVQIEVAKDVTPREVDVPKDLTAALDADPAVRAAFDALAYSHRKEFVAWVTQAKRPETRANRVAQTVEMVRDGQRR